MSSGSFTPRSVLACPALSLFFSIKAITSGVRDNNLNVFATAGRLLPILSATSIERLVNSSKASFLIKSLTRLCKNSIPPDTYKTLFFLSNLVLPRISVCSMRYSLPNIEIMSLF